jgi:hypothetical protein
LFVAHCKLSKSQKCIESSKDEERKIKKTKKMKRERKDPEKRENE